MNNEQATSQPTSPIPADDLNRQLTVADANGEELQRVSIVGNNYTILVSGAQTAGRYCLIDMLVPDNVHPA